MEMGMQESVKKKKKKKTASKAANAFCIFDFRLSPCIFGLNLKQWGRRQCKTTENVRRYWISISKQG